MQLPHGTAQILGYVTGRFGAIWRREQVKTAGDLEREERVMAVDERDNSPRYVMARGERSDCACCSLGIAHTAAKHQRDTR